MNHIAAAFLVSTVLVAPAIAATLRPLTTLSGPIVRLSDLFDDAGADADRVLGPAPAPGARIVVAAPQLGAIARQFGVNWQPDSPADQAVLERPGKLLALDRVMAALRSALAGLGAPADGDIALPGFAAPLVPLGAHAQAGMEQLAYDASSGRFTGILAVSGDGMDMLRLRLSGTVQAMLSLPVPRRRLPAGAVIGPDDLMTLRVRVGLAGDDVVRNPAQAVGMAVRHMTMPGQPLALTNLVRPAAVRKGARVAMRLDSPGISLAASGEAMQDGALGEQIPVLNPTSRAVVLAEIVGPDRVRVLPGSIPLQPARLRPAAAGRP
jgi:flagella basal body P-ring formation protein FlgA